MTDTCEVFLPIKRCLLWSIILLSNILYWPGAILDTEAEDCLVLHTLNGNIGSSWRREQCMDSSKYVHPQSSAYGSSFTDIIMHHERQPTHSRRAHTSAIATLSYRNDAIEPVIILHIASLTGATIWESMFTLALIWKHCYVDWSDIQSVFCSHQRPHDTLLRLVP